METSTPALDDPRLGSLNHTVVRHGRVGSLEEAAKARGVKPGQVVKTMVVRVEEESFVLVLVPGDRVIDWARLRKLVGVRRLTMADSEEAKRVTGYARGTITPFGAKGDLDIYSDISLVEQTVSIGGGAPGVSITVDGSELAAALDATVADVTKARDG